MNILQLWARASLRVRKRVKNNMFRRLQLINQRYKLLNYNQMEQDRNIKGKMLIVNGNIENMNNYNNY